MEQKIKTKRVLYFDGLRGLMALIVAYGHFLGETKLFMLSHYESAIPSSIVGFYKVTETTPFIFTINGNFATTVFFILSGCVLLNAFKANNSFIAAFVRRFLRLGIPVFISCLIGFVMIKYGLRSDYTEGVTFDEVIKQGILTLYTADFYTRYLNPVIWSMSTEFMGSIMLLIIAHSGKNNKNRGLLVLFIMTLLSYGYYVFFMLIGAWISIIFSDESIKNRLNNDSVALIIFALSIVVLLQSCPAFYPWGSLYIPSDFFVTPLVNLQSYSIAGMYPYHSYEFIRGIGGGLLLFLVITNQRVRGFLSLNIIQFFGKISFSLYLIHWLVLASIIMPINIFIYNNTSNVYFSIILSFIAFVFFTITCSILFYNNVELVAINYSRKMGKVIDEFIGRLNNNIFV